MYRAFGDPMLSQMIANEKINPKRESIELAFPGAILNTIRNGVLRFIDVLQVRREVQRLPEPMRVVACQEAPQFC